MADGLADETLALTNPRVASLLTELADLLDIKGDSSFKANAYRRAADAVARSPVEVIPAYRAGTPPTLPGVGKGIAYKLDELASSGRITELEELRARDRRRRRIDAPAHRHRAADRGRALAGARDRVARGARSRGVGRTSPRRPRHRRRARDPDPRIARATPPAAVTPGADGRCARARRASGRARGGRPERPLGDDRGVDQTRDRDGRRPRPARRDR